MNGIHNQCNNQTKQVKNIILLVQAKKIFKIHNFHYKEKILNK